MKIKQTTRIVVLAIALVAVIGVGAVSFAAWQGAPTINASASIGSVAVAGFSTTDAISMGTLVPYDQDLDKSTDVKGAKFLSVVLPNASVTGNYTITVTSATTIDVRVYIGAAISAAPTNEEGLAAFTTIKGDTNYTYNGTVTGQPSNNVYSVSGLYLNMILVSSELADMNASINDIVITIAPVATPAA